MRQTHAIKHSLLVPSFCHCFCHSTYTSRIENLKEGKNEYIPCSMVHQRLNTITFHICRNSFGCMWFSLYVCVCVCVCVVFVANKVKIDLLLLVYCDAVTQSKNMLISNGKVFLFLIIIFSMYISESMSHPPFAISLSHRATPTFNACGAKDGKLNWTKNVLTTNQIRVCVKMPIALATCWALFYEYYTAKVVCKWQIFAKTFNHKH